MSPTLHIAWRYFFARRKKSVVNIVSRISLIGIVVCAFALIVVLSVYNGIGNLTQSLFNVFDPELLVEPTQGKSFKLDTKNLLHIQSTDGVADLSPIVEEKSWATYGQNQAIVQLRGVERNYAQMTGIDSMIYDGSWIYGQQAHPSSAISHAILLGGEIYYQLGVSRHSNVPLMLHIPKRSSGIGFTMDDAFNQAIAYPSGFFVIQQDIDSRYALADIRLIRTLLDYDSNEYTSLAIKLHANANVQKVKKEIAHILSSAQQSDSLQNFTVKDRFEQQPLYYKIFRSERLAIYLILALITFISTFTLVASLSLLIIDKRHDSATLKAIGMDEAGIRRIFFYQGIFVAAIGTVIGLLLGFVVCFLQQQFGIVPMGENFVTQSFPVAMRVQDFLLTFLLVVSISTLSVWLTTKHCEV